MSEVQFAAPQWAHGLWAVLAFVVLLFWLERRGGSALDRLVGPTLQERLVARPASWRRRSRIALVGLACAALVVALMRPQWGVRHVATPQVGAELMIALDVSRSMLAEDVAPSRLERAKAEIADLLPYLAGDQVGLIAFAGRATVLAPLTPDFGFLRLALDETGPHSVSRGGTRLEEPIRKAVRGFGAAAGASRAILLITDGEDQDSFPLDAAKAAAEAGIVIVAIGFGDEAGSEVIVTDPRTGARSPLRDGQGRPVRSRLDGELLRDIALATGGAYVPAGTGVLDLESIYEAHLAGLTRGELDPRGRTVRDEAYPWLVLLALVCLLSSAGIAAGPAVRLAVLALALLHVGVPASAQPVQPDPPAQATPTAPAVPAPSAPTPEATPTETPREVYNRGVAALEAGAFDDAERALEAARRDAGDDAELRYRATYDLGWVAVQRAGRVEGEAPREALASLERGADWFRDAVRQRPDDDDARVNLEVALRRVLLLADRLAGDDDGALDAALERLAERERALAVGIATLHERAVTAGDPHAADRLREEFRLSGAEQRTILADADRLAADTVRERDALAARPDGERTPEDDMRAAQLEAVLYHLHRARERMGQTRGQLRERQGGRAYRRASAALEALKRARDPLLDPLALLDRLLRDAAEVAMQTAALAAAERDLPGRGPAAIPAWLSAAGVGESQRSLAERTGELERRLEAALGSTEPAPEEALPLLAAIQDAEPFVRTAQERGVTAADELDAERPALAVPAQAEMRIALAEARERFLDVKGLVEVIASDERRIADVLADESDEARAAREEYLPSLRTAQAKNVERAERLEAKLRDEQLRLAAPPSDPSAAPDPQVESERARLEQAGPLVTLALGGMDDALRALGAGDEPPRFPQASAGAKTAVAHLERLRRLFQTIVEQVRDLARRQVDLMDRTRDTHARAIDAPEVVAAPLAAPQRSLSERALELANALEEQSRAPAAPTQDADADPDAAAETLRLAAEHLLGAESEMGGAADALAAAPSEWESAHQGQTAALEALAEALALLEPPREPEEEGDDGEGEGEEPENGEGDGEEETPEAGPAQDPAQLLQGVRDREAQRRRERAARRPTTDTVERDW